MWSADFSAGCGTDSPGVSAVTSRRIIGCALRRM